MKCEEVGGAPPGSQERKLGRLPPDDTLGRLAAFKRPRLVRYLEALPRNALGKVLKHELRG